VVLSIGKVVPPVEMHVRVDETAIVCDFMPFRDSASAPNVCAERERSSLAFDTGLTAVVDLNGTAYPELPSPGCCRARPWRQPLRPSED